MAERIRLLLGTRSVRGLALLLVGLAACGRGPDKEPQPYADLVAAFPLAGLRYDARIPALGDPDAAPGQLAGFSSPRREGSREQPFVWSNRQESRVEFELFEPRPLVLEIGARASRSQGGRDQTLRIDLNGTEVTGVVVPRKFTTFEIELPVGLQRSGFNELTFSYSNPVRPRAEGVDRSRAIAWYRLSLRGQEREAATANSERDRLFLPFGSEVSYFVELRQGTHWVADRVALRAAGEGRLKVMAETDSGGLQELATFEGTAESVELDFGDVGLAQVDKEPVRVVFRSSGSSEDPGAGVVISRPRLAAPVLEQAKLELRPMERPPNVIFYLVDTLRVDRLGCYGYEKPITPSIDAFAEGAVVFDRAVGQSSWTRASVASLFTGLWPVSHGAVGRRDRLSEEALTLAEGLKTSGYTSAAFVTNANVDRKFGLGQGFDFYRQIHEFVRSGEVTDRVLHWLQREERPRPLFLYIHTIDPHDRYIPSPEYLQRFAPQSVEFLKLYRGRDRSLKPRSPGALEHLQALYDAEVAENDASFGRLLEGLEELDLYEDSIIVFMSDHGEEFFEHNESTHGKNLFAITLDFPLIVKFPGQRSGARTSRLVQHADLLPTVFELAGLEIPSSVEGRSFADLASGGNERDGSGPVYSHLHLDKHPHSSVVDGDWKLIIAEVSNGPKRLHLYNLAEDPGETDNLAARLPIRSAVMRRKLEAHLAASESRSQREAIVLDEELERSLRALGYLQ
jgi:arylsulfatase A-like enzyme